MEERERKGKRQESQPFHAVQQNVRTTAGLSENEGNCQKDERCCAAVPVIPYYDDHRTQTARTESAIRTSGFLTFG